MDLKTNKIVNNKPVQTKHGKQDINFGCGAGLSGLANGALRIISDDKFVGATFSDVGFMVMPRTAIDTQEGGPQLGIETGFREIMGVIDHSIIGLFGIAAGYLVSLGSGVNAGKITASTDNLKFLAGHYNNDDIEYSKNIIKNIHGLVDGEFKPLSGLISDNNKSDEVINGLAETLHGINTTPHDKLHKEAIESLAHDIRSAFKIPNTIKINGVETGIDTVIKDSHNLHGVFADVTKKGKDALPAFVENLSKISYRKTALGLAVAMTVGCSIQAINRLWTKKRTGKDGFPGASGGADKSNAFLGLRLGAMAGMIGLIGFSLGAHKDIAALRSKNIPFKDKATEFIKGIADKVQFNGKLPTINQLKLIYGTTIMSRFFASSQKDELREATIKDYLGYANWLLLGSFVTKLTAHKFLGNDNILNKVNNADKPDKPHFEVKSYDEVFAQVKGLELYKDGKRRGFGEIIKDLKSMKTEQAEQALKNIKHLNLSNGAGIIYSFLALGVALPYLNRKMTKHFDEKRQKEQCDKSVSQTNTVQPQTVVKNIPTVNPQKTTITYASHSIMSNEQKELFANFVKVK